MGEIILFWKDAPGSPKAATLGCVCPETDNRHGLGYRLRPGVFVIDQACPMHGPRRLSDEEA